MHARSSQGKGSAGRHHDGCRNLEDYRPLVGHIARKVAGPLPRHVEFDELVSAGTLGLVEASQRFDASRGVKFEAFVADRVRGAIIDHLRSVDWAPRSVRAAARSLDESTGALNAQLGRRPTEAELADACGESVESVRVLHKRLAQASLLTLDGIPGDDSRADDHDTLAAALEDIDAVSPDENIERQELYGYLADAVNCLPEQARTVIALYYVANVPMGEIGPLLGVTQSRASQIHAGALEMLRDALTAELAPVPGPVAPPGTGIESEPPAPPRGRRAMRLAEYRNSVSRASTWRERLDPARRRVNVPAEAFVA